MVPYANLIDVILRKTSLSFWEGGLIHISNWFQPIPPVRSYPASFWASVHTLHSKYTEIPSIQFPQSTIPYPIVNVINPFICYKIAKLNRIPMLSCCAPLNTAVIQSQYNEQNKSWQQKIRQYCTQLLFARSQAWLTRTISAYLALFGLPMDFLAKILVL